jgi:hypothetical protein
MPPTHHNLPDQVTAATATHPLTRACAAAIVIVIVGSALISGSTKHWLLAGFPSYLHVDKLGHALGFAVMAIACVRARLPRVRPWHVVAFALALGAFCELCQRFIPGRTSKLADVLIDVAGACAGLWIASRAA